MSIAATVGLPIITAIPACIHDGFVAFEHLKHVDQTYLLYVLKSLEDELWRAGQTGSQSNVNTAIVKGLRINLPPQREQRRIGEALLDVDHQITSLARIITKRQLIKQGMIQALLTGATRLPSFHDPWTTERWSDVTVRRPGNGQIKGRLSAVQTSRAAFPGFSASGQDVWLPSFDFEGPGVVVSAVGSRCGKCFYADGRWSAIANTHVVIPIASRLDGRFAFLYFNDESFWLKGGSGQPFVQVKASLMREVQLPALDEQAAIAAVLDDAQAQIDILRRGVAKACSVKQGMMQQLLSGRVRLPTLEAVA